MCASPHAEIMNIQDMWNQKRIMPQTSTKVWDSIVLKSESDILDTDTISPTSSLMPKHTQLQWPADELISYD